jgi:hypothetical protein
MRSIIDRDIARLEESIRALKSRRNELSPTASLAFLLKSCATYFLSLSMKAASITPSVAQNLWQTNFSQISQHWRSSALSSQRAATLDQNTS